MTSTRRSRVRGLHLGRWPRRHRREHGRRREPGRRRLGLPGGPVAVALIAAFACAEGPPPELTVGEVSFVRDELLGLTEERKRLLGEIVALGLSVRTGESESLVEPAVDRARRDYFARLKVAMDALDDAGVGEPVLEARYRTNPRFELTVRHLVVLSGRFEPDQQRSAARAEAEKALERVRRGERFPEVVADVSEEPGAEERQGLLSPGREGTWVPEFWSAARALDVGEISGIVETQYGFHVLRLEARDTVPFDETWPTVAMEAATLMGVDTDPSRLELPEGLQIDGDRLGSVTDGGTPDSVLVARWTDGTLTMGGLRDDLAALPSGEWEAALETPDALREAAEDAVRRLTAEAWAERRGVTPLPGRAAEVRQEWSEAVVRWRAQLGLGRVGTLEDLKRAAREALGANAQGPTLARQELHERSPLLTRRYPVRIRPAEDA